jgi:transcriptional regulator with XRE-family HTH domain
MSQERLAELIGVTFQQVQKYEKGINRIAASRLFDISAALDMSVARFFDGIGATKENSAAAHGESLVNDALATPEGMQLVTLFASIKSQKIRLRVVELVRSLASE